MSICTATQRVDAVGVSQTRTATTIACELHGVGPLVDDFGRPGICTFVPDRAVVTVYPCSAIVMVAQGSRRLGDGVYGEEVGRTMTDEDDDLPDWAEELFRLLAGLRIRPVGAPRRTS